MSDIHGIRWVDTTGAVNAFKNVDGQPRFVAQEYYQQIGEGNITGHSSWSKIGYTPTMTTTESDIWSLAGTYVFPTAAMGMEVTSAGTNAANDVGTVIHSGTSNGGSAVTLTSTGENFLTTTIAGDYVIIEQSGTTPEWGVITSIESNTQISFAAGLSSGGTGSGRTYSIIDTSATTGAQAVRFTYLDGSYNEKTEIVILNGTGVVATVNTNIFRINSFRVIAAGTGNAAAGNLSLRHIDNSPTYSYITALFTRARNIQYTVPYGKTLYINRINASFGYSGTQNNNYARMYTRANVDNITGFKLGNLFIPYTEMIISNSTSAIDLPIPTKLIATTDIKVSGIATVAGVAFVALRGWLETA